jgi:cell division protein ZapA
MPEVRISVGGREFDVACQEGEEHFLKAAAKMLDTEAATLLSQIGRMPESRMLLMAGLLLADKTAGAEDRLQVLEAKVGAQEAELETLRGTAQPAGEPQTIAVIPPEMTDNLAELAARSEAMASEIEEKLGAA